MAKLNGNSIELGSLTTTQRQQLQAAEGEVVYNSQTRTVEAYFGPFGWQPLGAGYELTGGTRSVGATYTTHTFLSSSTFTNTYSPLTIDYIVVAGGGGGGGGGLKRVVSLGNGGGGGGIVGLRENKVDVSKGTV